MAIFSYNNVAITAMSACLPKRVVDNRNFSDFFSEEEVEKVIKMTGIEYRRWADISIVISDLAYYAAKRLLEDNNLSSEDIDILIFCNASPDFVVPATTFILQDRLNLPNSTLCFDINMGCSGFVYSLNMAASFLQSRTIHKVLLVNGHVSLNYLPKTNKATSLLFGDGATATLIERVEEESKSYFSLNTDGAGYKAIIKEGGGYRVPTSEETLKLKTREDGSIRNDENASMDGPAVFDFTITEVPKDIKLIMKESGRGVEDIDKFVFHQANLFIIKHISRKLKIPMEKIPLSLDKFGNLSSVSLPLTMVSELSEELHHSKRTLLLTAFGVGLSWGSAVITTNKPYLSKIVEV